MTARLEKALKQLPPDAVEQVADFAEFLADKPTRQSHESTRRLRMNWAGAAAGMKKKYASGVEAAHAALDMMAASADPRGHT